MTLIGLSFGTGNANKEIAEELQKRKGRIIAQKEVGVHLKRKAELIFKHSEPGKYLDTEEVLKQARDKIKGWERVYIIAHRDHIHRAWKTANLIGLKVDACIVGSTSYDKDSEQWWTRRRIYFLIWDTIAEVWITLKSLLRKY